MPLNPLDRSDPQLVAEACGRAAQVLGLSPKELSEQPNRHLGEQPPRLLLARIGGLNCVADYLDSFCH